MKIQLLGTGGAFSDHETCYLVNDSVLIDCGPSAIKRTFADGRAAAIKDVFLTHIHMDHIGGIEALLYYRLYVTKTPLDYIYCPGEFVPIAQGMACFRDMNVKLRLLCIDGLDEIVQTPQGFLGVRPFRVNHARLEAYGFALRARPDNGRVVVISGDSDRAISTPYCEADIAAIFHDVGWEGLPDRADRVHPFEHEVLAAFPNTRLIGVHSSLDNKSPLFERAVADRIYGIDTRRPNES